MELNQSELQKYKQVLNDTMKAFIAFCKNNNLRYYACGGTCIGAIRHKGFIPWDDDIDVIMPRESYNRFLSLKNQLESSSYDILDPSVAGYYLPFAKFVNKNTTILETKEFPFIIGAFVDIFPQDFVGDAVLAQKLMFKRRSSFGKYCMAIKSHCLSGAIELLYKFRIKTFIKYCLYWLLGKHLAKRYFNEFHNVDLEIQNQAGDKCMCYDGFYGYKKEVCELDWFGEGKKVPFEDYFITVPQKCHEYLTHMFGDYMTPPPIEKQVSHHNLLFMDLEKRWDIKDIMKLNLKNQEKIEYTYE